MGQKIPWFWSSSRGMVLAMDYSFTEEQQQFRDIVARFCRDKAPTPVIRKLADSDTGFDPAVWQQFCQEVGVTGIHIDEAKGGSGFGPVELGIVMEELGRSLMPSPYFSCGVLACTAIAEINDVGKRDELLTSIMSGEKVATLALDSPAGHPVVGLEDADRMSGELKAVTDAAAADIILVMTGDHRRATLRVIESGADGVTVSGLRTMDKTRRLANVTLSNVAATQLGVLDAGQITRLYNIALVALANEMIGGAQALFDSALEYTKLRKQFGRTIASFQSIKHRLADLHVDVELAKVGAWQAAAALAAGEEESVNASLAKFMAADAYMQAALEAIQLHGGIGFTWENDTHLWYRRAKSSEVFLGKPAFHRERMLQEMEKRQEKSA